MRTTLPDARPRPLADGGRRRAAAPPDGRRRAAPAGRRPPRPELRSVARPAPSARHPAVRNGAERRRDAGRSTAHVGLVAILALLTLVGVVMVLSASSVLALREAGSWTYYFTRQLVGIAGGAALFLVTARVDYRRWRRLAPALYGLVLVLLVLVLVPGVGAGANGASRWIDLGIVQVQPSEFGKLAVLLVVADLLARRQACVHDLRRTIVPTIVVLVPVVVLLMLQPNLGTTIITCTIALALLFALGVRGVPLATTGVVGGALALGAALAADYRRARLLAFLDPSADPASTGYQIIQSQVSLASGGLLGVGLGASRQKWGFLPEAHTDFIFAIIGEELGLVGAATVVALFVALGFLGLRTAARAPDCFGRLVACGITTWFCIQAFVNIGAVIGILPITGVPLPFISFGSSAMLANLAAAGMLVNICRQSRA